MMLDDYHSNKQKLHFFRSSPMIIFNTYTKVKKFAGVECNFGRLFPLLFISSQPRSIHKKCTHDVVGELLYSNTFGSWNEIK